MTQLIAVENKSSTPDATVALWAEGVNYQLETQFNRSGWVRRKLAHAGAMRFFAAGDTPPADAWLFTIVDHSDQAGALGYHDDQAGKPYGIIAVMDSENDHVAPSAVLSHEALETLGDPWVDPMQPQMTQRPGTDKWYIRELCDPVQGGDYSVTTPGGATVAVSAFCLPSWWELSSFRPTSNTGDVREPWQLDRQGYMSIFENGQWTQVYGSEKAPHVPDPDDPGARAPVWDHRLQRIHRAIKERGGELQSGAIR